MPHRPVILGLAGDSAAGKTTLATGLAGVLGADQVTVICTDDYHRYNRRQRQVLGVSALHPDGNNIEVLEADLELLAAGDPIRKPVYNHQSGEFDVPEELVPRRFVIVEGLLGFATPRLREHIQIKLYLDPPENVRHRWKIQRDISERGYTLEQALADLQARESDSAEFIRPQRRWADMVVRFVPDGRDEASMPMQLVLRQGLPQLDFGEAIARAGAGRPAMRQRVGRDEGRLTELVDIDGQVDGQQLAAATSAINSQLGTGFLLDTSQAGRFVSKQQPCRSYPLALTELLIAFYLANTRQLPIPS